MTPPKLNQRILNALGVTAELCGTPWSPAAMQAAVLKLQASYPVEAVLAALDRCQNEASKLTLPAIIERIDDGRPSADEAWAQVGTLDESRTLITTTEALEAFGLVRDLMREDEVGARMAFREAYRRLVMQNKAEGVSVQWTASLGHDKGQRETVLRDAIERGRLSEQEAKIYGILDEPKGEPLKLLPGKAGGRNELAAENFATVLRVLEGGLSTEEAEQQIQRRYGVGR